MWRWNSPFSEELRKFNITMDDILNCYLQCPIMGGAEEIILTYLAYKFRIPVQELPMCYNSNVFQADVGTAKIVHFVDRCAKPWENPAILMLFPEWDKYYKKWLLLGGDDVFSPKGAVFRKEMKPKIEYLIKLPNLIQISNNLHKIARNCIEESYINLDKYEVRFTTNRPLESTFWVRSHFVNTTLVAEEFNNQKISKVFHEIQKRLALRSNVKITNKSNSVMYELDIPLSKIGDAFQIIFSQGELVKDFFKELKDRILS